MKKNVMRELWDNYELAKAEVLSVHKSIKWCKSFDLDGEVLDDLYERLQVAVQDFEFTCEQLELAGIPLAHLVLKESGVETILE